MEDGYLFYFSLVNTDFLMPGLVKTIMQIIPTLEIGGAELLLLSICEGLSKKDPNIKFVIVVLYESNALALKFINAGFKVISLNLDKKRFISKIVSIYRCIKLIKPDIIHTHLIPADRFGLIAAFFAGVKYRVSTAHSQQIDPILSDQMTPYLYCFLTTHIVAVSQAVKNYYVKHFKLSPAKISVIYNAPSFSLETKASPKKHPGKNALFKIVVVANCKPAKGQLVLIKAIKENMPEQTSLSIDIYGDCSSEYGSLCLEEINSSAIKLPITLKGSVDNVPDILGEYHLMISVSLWEGFPLSIVEGMVHGLPIIATDIGPHKEIFGPIDNFPFVKPGVSGDLFTIIEKVVSDPDYYNYLSKMNLQRAADFTQDKLIDNYYNLYYY
jgi:glycosyltransferase involved in cell wall biosynthesis